MREREYRVKTELKRGEERERVMERRHDRKRWEEGMAERENEGGIRGKIEGEMEGGV